MRPVTILELRQPIGAKRLDLWSLARRIEKRVEELGGPAATSRRPAINTMAGPDVYPIRWLDIDDLYVRVAFYDVVSPLPVGEVPLALLITPEATQTALAEETPPAPVVVLPVVVPLSPSEERRQLIEELAELLEGRSAAAKASVSAPHP